MSEELRSEVRQAQRFKDMAVGLRGLADFFDVLAKNHTEMGDRINGLVADLLETRKLNGLLKAAACKCRRPAQDVRYRTIAHDCFVHQPGMIDRAMASLNSPVYNVGESFSIGGIGLHKELKRNESQKAATGRKKGYRICTCRRHNCDPDVNPWPSCKFHGENRWDDER